MTKHKSAKWDVQHHMVPEAYVKELARQGVNSVAPFKFPKWTPKKSLAMMDRWNIDKAIMSVSCPGIHFGDDQAARKLARTCNDFHLDCISAHPDRFGGFASVPLPDVQGAIDEYEYAVKQSGMDGVVLMSNVGGRYIGDAAYRPFFEKLNDDGAVIYIHPNTAPEREGNALLNCFWWWPLDTTKALMSLIWSGYYKDYPRIRYIAAHGGGIFPAIYPYLVQQLKQRDPNIEVALNEWKERLYLDTARAVIDELFDSVLQFTDLDHLMFASDYPWAGESKMYYWTKEIDSKGLSETALVGIYKRNAYRVLSGETVNSTPVTPERPGVGLLPPVHYHAMPRSVEPALAAFGNETTLQSTQWFDITHARTWVDTHKSPCRLTLDFPALWTHSNADVSRFLCQYNDGIAQCMAAYPSEIQGFGAINVSEGKAAITEIDRCINDLQLSGICLYTDISETPLDRTLDPSLIDRLAKLRAPIMIHPKNALGLPIENTNYLDSVYFMAKILHSGEIDKLRKCSFILTHTCNTHRILRDDIGVLYYLRHKRWHLLKMAFDYIRKADLRGEALLKKVIAD